MATYLVDYENVRCDDLMGISRLREGDRVILFYSEKADKISIGLHRRIMECKAAIEYRKADVGAKDALDFQLVTYLGYLIAAAPAERFCVISNDHGFEYAANFWRKQKFDVRLMPSIVAFDITPPEEAPAAAEAEAVTAPAPETDAVPAPQSSPEPEHSEASDKDTEPAQEPEAAEPALPPVASQDVAPLTEEPAETEAESTPTGAAARGPRPYRARERSRTSRSRSQKPRTQEASKTSPDAETGDKTPQPESDNGVMEKAVAAILGGEEAAIVSEYILRYKSKLGINNALVKKYGNQRGGEIYQKIKSLIANKKGN